MTAWVSRSPSVLMAPWGRLIVHFPVEGNCFLPCLYKAAVVIKITLKIGYSGLYGIFF